LICGIFTASQESVQVLDSSTLTAVGYIVRDPKSRKTFVPKDAFFVYSGEFKDKMKAKFTAIAKAAKHVEKYRFTTTIEVPESFATTAVGNYSKGFTGLTMKKIINRINRERKSQSPKRKSSSKSP
jgi:hypothetical protein